MQPPMHTPPSRRHAARTTQLGTAERARHRIVSLVMLVYLLLILEGALRKWLLPSFGQLLFFIRDPFVVWIYWIAARNGFIPRGQPLLIAGIAFGIATIFWLGLQADYDLEEARGLIAKDLQRVEQARAEYRATRT